MSDRSQRQRSRPRPRTGSSRASQAPLTIDGLREEIETRELLTLIQRLTIIRAECGYLTIQNLREVCEGSDIARRLGIDDLIRPREVIVEISEDGRLNFIGEREDESLEFDENEVLDFDLYDDDELDDYMSDSDSEDGYVLRRMDRSIDDCSDPFIVLGDSSNEEDNDIERDEDEQEDEEVEEAETEQEGQAIVQNNQNREECKRENEERRHTSNNILL